MYSFHSQEIVRLMKLQKVDSFKFDDIAKLCSQLFGTSTRDKTVLPSAREVLKAAVCCEFVGTGTVLNTALLL